ncbi:uncharacterized protein LOC105285969 [Ooceraea biroi]|uniref:uncharacterized protein LOC105285969 n=1 Tax=Ooceraea biroi TaxID=2015173 RepID=UPI00097164D1|nr:uncharacterized protein LOC105285969 [Ooceraea biroi]
MPQWPKSVNEDTHNDFSTSSPTSSTSVRNKEEENLVQSPVLETQQEIENVKRNEEILKPYQERLIILTAGNTRILVKMVAALQLQMKSVMQRIDRITPTVKIISSIERIKSYLPLKSIEDIQNIETLLQEEDFVNEYVSIRFK